MKAKHTPEPWQDEMFQPDGPGEDHHWQEGVVDSKGVPIALMMERDEDDSEFNGPMMAANAKRTVECVNGCKGMKSPTETIPDVREFLAELSSKKFSDDTPNWMVVGARSLLKRLGGKP